MNVEGGVRSVKIGVLGGGQLGRMLGLAGVPLGAEFRFFDPSEEAPARAVGEVVRAGYEDAAARERWAEGLDVVTYEFENVPGAAVEALERGAPVWPPVRALRVGQDRLAEKEMFRALGLGTPEFAAVGTPKELAAAVERIGVPCVVKTRRMGYDGKGQAVVRDKGEVAGVWARVAGGRATAELIVEAFVRFEFETSMIACRGRDGRAVFYPMPRNTHREGILRVARAGGRDAAWARVESKGREYARAVLEHLGYVGVLTIEFFAVRGAGGQLELLANEMAPRVHNSGHWTIEGSVCSQFENHVRAVAGWPLGSPAWRVGDEGAASQGAAMVNLIGVIPEFKRMMELPGAHVHVYGKEPREGRKVGHVTFAGVDEATREAGIAELQELMGGPRE